MAKTTILDSVKSAVDGILEEIDSEIENINKKLRPYDALIEKRNELTAARRALLGGSKLTGGSGGTQVRQEDIVRFLNENPGSSPSEIATHFNVNAPLISSHLSRGKNERFLTVDKKWWVRDPKNGLNTADDIDTEE